MNRMEFLESETARRIFERIQKDGTFSDSIGDDVPPNDRAFLTSELYVRTSRYGEISRALPANASEWSRRLAICTGYLFTAPVLAIKELDYLEPLCQSAAMKIRLKMWRLHLCTLVGFEEEGSALRNEIETVDLKQSPFAVELYTLLAISYFSTAQSKKAVAIHHKCLELTGKRPERYFTTLNAALGMRTALKICDARSFDVFSKVLDESLAQEYDNRYKLRQLGYRASILTQLGETDIAAKYWHQGDLLLESVDPGAATIERAQYLTFRCLAAAILGDLTTVDIMYRRGVSELHAAHCYDVHLAELEVCKILAPIANPTMRAQNIAQSFHVLTNAVSSLAKAEESAGLESVKECYREAAAFCEGLLSGKTKKPRLRGGDPWRTLTLSVLNNYQNLAAFAEKVDYFRLLPCFVRELEQTSLTDSGIKVALGRVIKITPTVTEGGFEIGFERDEIYKVSEVNTLLGFANTLRQLYKKSEENSKTQILADTVRTIAHDFRRPFNLFRMALNSISMTMDPKETKSLAAAVLPKIVQLSEEVERMLDDVVDAARPMKLDKKEVQPHDVVTATLESFKIAAKGVIFQTHFIGSQRIIADEAKIKRAVANILENAVQATQNGKIWITTKTGTLHHQDAAVITIGNHSYIPQEDRKKLFEKYFSKGKSNGTGLGLYIVKRIMDEHGGVVRCRSSQASGTEFDLVVPLA